MTDAPVPKTLPPSGLVLWLGGTVLIWALYVAVFMLSYGVDFGLAARDAMANVIPLALLAAMTHAVLLHYILPRTVWQQAVLHVPLAIGFAIFWYAAIILLLGFFSMLMTGRFAPAGFGANAFVWQVFQGLILYALVAAVCYAIRGGRAAAMVTLVDQPMARDTGQVPGGMPFDRYLTKHGEDICPVEIRNIVSITGAQDYSEVSTIDGTRHLVRMSLGEFEARLDRARFLRVHRSAIINFDHMARAEPAGGGRMIVHMANGESVRLSRAGTLLLRQFIV